MTKYLNKAPFSVPMPGEAAKCWPRCEALNTQHRAICLLEWGHKGKHRGPAESLPPALGPGRLPDCVCDDELEWDEDGERWIWRNGKREAA